MNEHTWNDCLETNTTTTITPDIAKTRSLIDTANGRIDYLRETPTNEKNANYLFEGYYSSALELLHALLTKQGYKVANHICLGLYIRDTLNDQNLFRIFDDCRYKRNALIYYGKKMDYDTAQQAIQKTKTLIQKITKHLTT